MDVLTHPASTPMTISSEERAFFVGLGEHIAQLRKASGVTQVQLAEALNVSQQTMQAYEVGRRRIPVSALPLLARSLSVSLEELLGDTPGNAKKRGPPSRLQQHIERISQLPKPKQRFVMEMLETVLAQASR
jgi:transcriptional regulator with XRE-family HTH domain